jgi:hypothetical protein
MTPQQLAAIEDAIREVGSFGEVGIVIANGRVAFVTTKKSLAIRDQRQMELEVR